MLIILLVAILLIAGALGAYTWIKNSNQADRLAEEKIKSEAQTESAKKNIVNNSKAGSTDTSKDLGSNVTTTDQIPVSSNLSVTITNFQQVNSLINSSASISGNSSEGTCVFTYSTPGSKPVVDQVSSKSSVCSSIIPEVQFSKLGSWNLNIVFYLNDGKAEGNKNVTIN